MADQLPISATIPALARAPTAGVSSPSPLTAALLFTFFNSVCGGVVSTGISFLTESAYGFTQRTNYWLGLIMGVTYVAGALAVGPSLRRAVARLDWLSTRLALRALMLVMGALCTLPWAVRLAAPPDAPPHHGSWAVFLLIALYMPLSGALWPIVESYVSGGREGRTLRGATGAFNLVWSSAIIGSFWLMAPLKEHHALEAVAVLAAFHAAALVVTAWFRPDPARHADHGIAAPPPLYRELLPVCRVLLATTYMVITALAPFLPVATRMLALPAVWQTPAASAWLVSRTLTFYLLQRRRGWHGRWRVPIVGGSLLLGGFTLAVIGPWLPGAAGLAAFIGGLFAFGIGAGAIYAAALYYAMAVGAAEVDAGGKHEALIGLGYAAGPACGLLAGTFVTDRLAERVPVNIVMLIIVGGIAAIVGTYAIARAALRASRTAR